MGIKRRLLLEIQIQAKEIDYGSISLPRIAFPLEFMPHLCRNIEKQQVKRIVNRFSKGLYSLNKISKPILLGFLGALFISEIDTNYSTRAIVVENQFHTFRNFLHLLAQAFAAEFQTV